MNGVIKSLKAGFGFIRGDDGVEYFFHVSSLRSARFDELQIGQGVSFSPTTGPKGVRAEHVEVTT